MSPVMSHEQLSQISGSQMSSILHKGRSMQGDTAEALTQGSFLLVGATSLLLGLGRGLEYGVAMVSCH